MNFTGRLPSDKLLRFPQGCAVSEIPEFVRIHGLLNHFGNDLDC